MNDVQKAAEIVDSLPIDNKDINPTYTRNDVLKAIEIYDTWRLSQLPPVDEEKAEDLKAKVEKIVEKEVAGIKKYIRDRRVEALKNNGENTALLVFIQQLEEAFTWVRNV